MDFKGTNFNGFWMPQDLVGTRTDMHFLANSDWLLDTQVTYDIQYEKGSWSVYLVFASIHDAFTFVCRKINSFYSEARAKICAQFYQRCARKDPRGNLNVNLNEFNICHN